MQNDSEAATLSILHMVYGVFHLLAGLVGLPFLIVGLTMLADPPSNSRHPILAAGIVGSIGLVTLAIFAVLGVLSIICASRIKQRRSWTFCVVMSGFHCMNFPLGTALGIFSLLHLMKPEMRARFR